mmetsp:Transcript_121656/g.349658  ORF Transcript_121656/g.349658 Transcript_121656/m.349658 type:complete len:215 (-) Transcript_121656:296-940(-)
MPSERFISTRTFSTAARVCSGLLGSSKCAVPLPPPPWMLLIKPFSLLFIAATAFMKPWTHSSLAFGSVRSTPASSSERTTNGGVGAPTSLQMRLKPIFSRPWLATGSVPGHTRPSFSTATAASADSAKADQPGMNTTFRWVRWRCKAWSREHKASKRCAKWSMLPQDLGFTYRAPSIWGKRCLPSSRVWNTRTRSPQTARMSASTDCVACLDWL